MKKQISVKCVFSKEEDVLNILQQSFNLYLTRILAERNAYAK